MTKEVVQVEPKYDILKPTGREFIKMGFTLIKSEGELTSLQRLGLEIAKLPLKTDFTQVLDTIQGWLELVRDAHIKSGDWDSDWKPYLSKLGLLKVRSDKIE